MAGLFESESHLPRALGIVAIVTEEDARHMLALHG